MRQDDEKGEKENKKGSQLPPLSIEITIMLLIFLGSVALISLLREPQISTQGFLNIVTIAAFPFAYGIWMRKKWAFYASLILLEVLILISPLIAAFSPYFGIQYNWISCLSFIVVGLTVIPLLIANEQHFGFLKEARLQTFIKNLPIFNTLFIIFGVALIIRTLLPYNTVFKDTVRFASDDAVMHMRLVENALFGDHFPRRLFFDAYTYFPHGTYIHFAPLFDQIIIFATWIIGLGSPAKALMEAVGAYYPAILGSLVVFPVYIIGRELYNKYAGLIASVVVATLPGQFLSRSIIGFTDHHVGEALFSTIAVMLLVLAIKRAKEGLSDENILDWFRKSPGEWIRSKNFPFLCYVGAILLLFQVMPWEWWVFLSFILFLLAPLIFTFWKRPDSYVFYSLLAGMALGFYLLTWIGGLFFVFIFFLFGVLHYTVNGLRREPNGYICVILSSIFFVSLLIELPFYPYPFVFCDIRHIAALGASVVIFVIPLLYRYLSHKVSHEQSLVREKISKAESKKSQKIGIGGYTCPICGKKSRSTGIVEHIKTKHSSDSEAKSTRKIIKQFLAEHPELSAVKKSGIDSGSGYSPLEKISEYEFLLPLFTIAVFLGLSVIFFPSIIGSFGVLTPSGNALTIGEVHPMDPGTAWIWFTTPLFIAFFAMAILAMNIVTKNKPEEFLILVWSIIMFVAVGGLGIFGIEGIGQNRFAYYYAINAAILTGIFSVKAFEFLTGDAGKTAIKEPVAEARSKRKGGKTKRSGSSLDFQLIAFAFAIMVIFIIGILKVGIESLIPIAGIVVIFSLWWYAVSTGRVNIEKPLTKTLAILLIMVIVFYPFPLNAVAKPFPSLSNLPLSAAYAINTAKGGIGADEDWYEALRWMRNNTPEPGMDYYGLYAEPPLNVTTGTREDYNYPSSAYGVMSWWDYGHIITWIAHRIPNANPFQEGIGGPIGSDNPGACVFFIEDNESEANNVADALGVRYVISDFMMADVWNSFYNKYAAMTVWAGDPQRYNTLAYYYQTMEARLHMFDGASVEIDGENISALAHYRLVHESPTFILPLVFMNASTGMGYWRSISGEYNYTESQALILHGRLFSMPVGIGIEEDLDKGLMPEMLKSAFNSTGIPLSEDSTISKGNEGRWIIRDEKNKNVFIIEKKEEMLNVYLYGLPTGQPNIKVWTPEYMQPVSFVKVFEYVKGARIEGAAPNGSLIEISTDITTNQGRTFTYSAKTVANGSYEFIVPYSTEGPIEGGTNFDVFASPYKIRAGYVENETVVWDVEKEVSVPEEAVMKGKTIREDLL